MTAPTLGVQIGDGLVIFGKPRVGSDWWAGGVRPDRKLPAWLGGLTADEYERIIREARP